MKKILLSIALISSISLSAGNGDIVERVTSYHIFAIKFVKAFSDTTILPKISKIYADVNSFNELKSFYNSNVINEDIKSLGKYFEYDTRVRIRDDEASFRSGGDLPLIIEQYETEDKFYLGVKHGLDLMGFIPKKYKNLVCGTTGAGYKYFEFKVISIDGRERNVIIFIKDFSNIKITHLQIVSTL